jgi:hypothetical protein
VTSVEIWYDCAATLERASGAPTGKEANKPVVAMYDLDTSRSTRRACVSHETRRLNAREGRLADDTRFAPCWPSQTLMQNAGDEESAERQSVSQSGL